MAAAQRVLDDFNKLNRDRNKDDGREPPFGYRIFPAAGFITFLRLVFNQHHKQNT